MILFFLLLGIVLDQETYLKKFIIHGVGMGIRRLLTILPSRVLEIKLQDLFLKKIVRILINLYTDKAEMEKHMTGSTMPQVVFST